MHTSFHAVLLMQLWQLLKLKVAALTKEKYTMSHEH